MADLERVTEPTHPALETTPKPAGARRQKDPKKVAAGQAGAAARKAKHQQLLAELQEAKRSIAPPLPSGGAQALDTQDVSSGELTQTAASPSRTPRPAVPAATDWTPWIAGGLGLAGILWVVTKRTPVPLQCKRARTTPPPGPVHHLKGPDPFLMQ